MADVTLTATPRTEFGKGAARRLRRDKQIPAVLYGHGTDPVHVALPGHQTMMALKKTNALFEIELAGKTTLAIAKDVQVEPVRHVIEHVDLLIVKRGEKIAVDVPVRVLGESAPGTIHLVETQDLQLEAEATNLPSSVELDITGLGDGTVIRAGDVTLPVGSTLVSDPTHIVVTISTPSAEPVEAETTEGAEDEESETPAAEEE
ncbi:MAG: 50S ribosomal protein L25/general stress protein Ctc [Micrococcales bacterium]|nr:50S ribosomal protein L25/general stress protein Ctc [Micrococcales bacterium]MCL2667320.1 50S ribosomal protein L25/general stress protein Ctc [Micrococcales bacterium]